MAHEELQKQYAIDAEYSETPWLKWQVHVGSNTQWETTPRLKWQVNVGSNTQWETCNKAPSWSPDYEYRRKYKVVETDVTITIKAGDRWTKEPPKGTVSWVVNLRGEVVDYYGMDGYKGGQLFKTQEAAQAFADALKIK